MEGNTRVQVGPLDTCGRHRRSLQAAGEPSWFLLRGGGQESLEAFQWLSGVVERFLSVVHFCSLQNHWGQGPSSVQRRVYRPSCSGRAGRFA